MTSQNACWKGRRLIDYFNIQYTKIINSHKLDGAKLQKKIYCTSCPAFSQVATEHSPPPPTRRAAPYCIDHWSNPVGPVRHKQPVQ